MTTLREAAEIALDVLEDSCYPRASMRDFNRYDDTIETLRKALANHSERDLDMVAAAPQRKPLSDGQIGRLCGKFDARHSVAVGIAREIEKAHGIGEKE